jgi:hypothetical protein
LASARFDLIGGFVDLLPTAGRGDDIDASLGEAETQGVSNAGGTSGHNCSFAFKAQKLSGHSVSLFWLQAGLLPSAWQGFH